MTPTTVWVVVLAASAVCFALKLAGHLVPEHWLADERVSRTAALVTAALLAALVAVQTVGDGQALKLVNQLLAGVHIAAAAEALGFAAALGLDPRAAWEVVRHGAAGSFMLGDRGARMLDGEFEPVRSALDIFVKDMGLVVGAAKSRKLPTPLASAAEQLYLAGAAEGLGRPGGRGAPPARGTATERPLARRRRRPPALRRPGHLRRRRIGRRGPRGPAGTPRPAGRTARPRGAAGRGAG